MVENDGQRGGITAIPPDSIKLLMFVLCRMCNVQQSHLADILYRGFGRIVSDLGRNLWQAVSAVLGRDSGKNGKEFRLSQRLVIKLGLHGGPCQ